MYGQSYVTQVAFPSDRGFSRLQPVGKLRRQTDFSKYTVDQFRPAPGRIRPRAGRGADTPSAGLSSSTRLVGPAATITGSPAVRAVSASDPEGVPFTTEPSGNTESAPMSAKSACCTADGRSSSGTRVASKPAERAASATRWPNEGRSRPDASANTRMRFPFSAVRLKPPIREEL